MGGAGQPKDRCDDCGEHMSCCTCVDETVQAEKPETCKECGGRGGSWSRPSIMGGQVWHSCLFCGGTGKVQEEEEKEIDPVKLFTDSGFHKELVDLLNKYGIDNYADVPDYLLANYIIGSVLNLDALKQQTG